MRCRAVPGMIDVRTFIKRHPVEEVDRSIEGRGRIVEMNATTVMTVMAAMIARVEITETQEILETQEIHGTLKKTEIGTNTHHRNLAVIRNEEMKVAEKRRRKAATMIALIDHAETNHEGRRAVQRIPDQMIVHRNDLRTKNRRRRTRAARGGIGQDLVIIRQMRLTGTIRRRQRKANGKGRDQGTGNSEDCVASIPIGRSIWAEIFHLF